MYPHLWLFFLVSPGIAVICVSVLLAGIPPNQSRILSLSSRDRRLHRWGPLPLLCPSSSLPSNFLKLASFRKTSSKNPYLEINSLFLGGGGLTRCVLKSDCLENDILFLLPLKNIPRCSFLREKEERLSQDSVIREARQLVSRSSCFSKPAAAEQVSLCRRHSSS